MTQGPTGHFIQIHAIGSNMHHLINPALVAKLSFLAYRYRFVALYILFGALSLAIELVSFRGLSYMNVPSITAQLAGLVLGILFAFWTNVRFNFKVPVRKRNRALAMFGGISLASATLNFVFRNHVLGFEWTYEQGRLVLSSILFAFGYLLHRRFSFADRKQVGVAVYANGVENIREIATKIADYPDFIHVDLIDETFGDGHIDVRSYRLEAIRAYWPRKNIQLHIMSKRPKKWIADALPHVDTIIVHREIEEDLNEVLEMIHQAGKKVGLALMHSTPPETSRQYIHSVSVLMLLCIEVPGRSGQQFQISTLDKINAINAWPERDQFALCVDGGVGTNNIHLLNVELVVSGSSVLSAENPARQIMRLQTSNNHEAT